MAHQLTDSDSMFSVREMPWHGLGTVLPDYPTRAEAQQLAHPWEPITEPVFRRVIAVREDGTLDSHWEEISGSLAMVRSDNSATLGVVNETRGIVGNGELWDIAEAVGSMGRGSMADIQIETAGSLAGGQQVWILLRLAEPIVVKGDPHGATLAMFSLQNNHVSGALRGQAHNTRIVCANTSAAADASAKATGHEFNFRHSSGVHGRIEEAKAAVSLWRSDVDDWQQVMDTLMAARITSEQQVDFIERWQAMPPEHLTTSRVRHNVEKAREEYLTILRGETCEGIDLTAYGLYQAATEWSQHYRTTRGKDQRSRMESHFRRSVLDDGGLRRSTLALVREVAAV